MTLLASVKVLVFIEHLVAFFDIVVAIRVCVHKKSAKTKSYTDLI